MGEGVIPVFIVFVDSHGVFVLRRFQGVSAVGGSMIVGHDRIIDEFAGLVTGML